MTVLRPSVALVLALLLPTACRSQERGREEMVVSAVQHGRYTEALQQALRLVEERPNDPEVAELLRQARLAYVMDQGRDEVFHGDLERALELFEHAESLAPGHPVVTDWTEKTRAQLAVHWLDQAADEVGPERLDQAEIAYEKVLQYDPENEDARRGLAHVLLLKNYRAGMSKTYFDDGLSSFRELLLQQARRSFHVSQRYRDNEQAAVRNDQVEQMMAEERLTQAQNFEEEGFYFAARNEYRLVLLIDPDNEEGRAGLDRMDREVRTDLTLGEAEMDIRRGDLETAEEKLQQAETLTEAQKEDVTVLKSEIEDRKLDELYQRARNLETDYRYPDAVEAYDALLALVPDYHDATLRRQTLEEFIRLAEEFYIKATESADPAEREKFLRAIPVIWPEYRDVDERLRDLEARKGAAGAGQDGG